MKFAYMFVDVLVRLTTSLLIFDQYLFLLFAYILVRFVQKFVGDTEGLLSCLWIPSDIW